MVLKTKKLIILSSVIVIVLLAGIAFAISALLKDDQQASVSSSAPAAEASGQAGSQSGNGTPLSGRTAQVKGRVTSLRNLNGLTLRINQLDTCANNAVTAYIAVSNDQGVVATNFNKNDIKVYLDGREIKDFDFNPVSKTSQPLNNVLVIDRSGSMKGAPIDNAKAAATNYVQSAKNEDKTAIIQFDDQVDVLAGLSSDKNAAKTAIAGIQVRGNTALFDSLSTALDQLPECGRKAVTILSDGDDTASKNATLAAVSQKAIDKKLPIFSLGLEGEGFNPATLSQISDGSGGQLLQAKTASDIGNLYQNIDGQLRGQFAANFKINLKRDGQSHTVRIVSNIQGAPTESTRTFTY